MEQIEIALAANQSYVQGLYVTACSIAEHCDKVYGLRFNVLDSEIPDADKKFVEEKVRALHANSSFRWIPVNEQMFVGLQKWNGGYMVYTRLLLPKLLSDCDWAIYCDCDFLWWRDIAELWRERDDRFGVISTVDGSSVILNEDAPWFRANGFPFDLKTYFCAGLTFFNLKMFREKGWQERCLELLQTHPPYNDQSVLNVVTEGVKKLLAKPKWQCFTLELSQKEMDDGVVIHYAGEIPWKPFGKHGMISGSFYLWHQMNARYRGIATWQSLRMFYSPWQIVRHRAPYYFWRLPGMIGALKIVCKVLHKSPSVWRMKEARVRRLVVGGW